jgi:hypothetical protein
MASFRRKFGWGVILVSALSMAGCADWFGDDVVIDTRAPLDPDSIEAQRQRDGSVLQMFGINSSIGTGEDRGEAFAGTVNKHIWLASLDTLSFLPIASTDPFTGVIATDWGGATDAQTERFRVTAFVTDTALSPESLRVAVFREVRGDGGAWVTAPVAQETPRQIEDSILVRARQLRIEEAGRG